MKMTLCLCAILFILPLSPAYAELYKYTDDSGQNWVVNKLERVPERYKENAIKVEEPQINNFPYINNTNTQNREKIYVKKETKNNATSQEKEKIDTPKETKNSKRTVEIYITEWCGYCKRLESFLKSKGIEYKRYDIEKNYEAREKYNQLGGRGVPLVKVGSQVIKGFDPDAILSAYKR